MANVAVCCDVGRTQPFDRLVRCLALAEELTSRGSSVTFVCDVASVRWADLQIRARGLAVASPGATAEEHVQTLDRLGADAVVFDSAAGDDVCAAVRDTGRATLAIVDQGSPTVPADIVVDPNVAAEEGAHSAPSGPTVLAGMDYVLVRNDVLANRPVSAPARGDVEVPRVTAVFDDAESASVAPAMARALAATGRPFEATFVASEEQVRAAVTAVRPAPRQVIEAIEPDWRLCERLARSDVVLGPAGPATYEWLCLGASLGLTWVTEGQVERYRRLMVSRAVVGLGSAADLEADSGPGAEKMTRLLSDARERSRLAETGWRLVDGFGRARVADALLALQ